MNNKLRYSIIMVVGVLMNEVFYYIASLYHWPVWLDVCGTAFAAFALEPMAGLLVGLVNNFILSITQYGANALIYYSISAAVALVAGCHMRDKNGKFLPKRVLSAVLLVTLISATLNTIFAAWRSGGELMVGWERTAYEYVYTFGLPKLVTTFLASCFIKLLDTTACGVIVGAFYVLLPKGMKFVPYNQFQKKQKVQ